MNGKVPLGAILLTVLSGCGSSFRDFVRTERLEEAVTTGAPYRHVVLKARGSGAPRSRLHIYIGGDGVPWRGGRTPSDDPTPRELLDLRLMALDPSDAVYLGRPCYFGLAKDPGCGPDVWTFARFSEDVVASMVSVARQIVGHGAYEQVVLIGYSGGGALARLMAPKVPHVVGLLTVAGNLDTAVWTDVHGYLPLSRSRNPADEPPLDASVVQVHAIGGKDVIVPAVVTESYVARHSGAVVWRYPDYGHVCCWLEGWPAILARLEKVIATPHETAQPDLNSIVGDVPVGAD
jgi:pimeloyl-ACP methyl ester carboxylesterase